MRWIVLLLFSVAFGIGLENRCVQNIEDLSAQQIKLLRKVYKYGEKLDLGYTLAAIAWKESCAGEYRMNFQDPSAGIFHAHIPTVLKRYPHLGNDGFTQNRIGERLVRDDEFAAKEAIEQLLYWRKVHNGDWEKIIKSYNKGFSWQKDKEKEKLANAYLRDVTIRYKQLKQQLHSVRPKSKRAAQQQKPQQSATPKSAAMRSFNDGFVDSSSLVTPHGSNTSFQLMPDY